MIRSMVLLVMACALVLPGIARAQPPDDQGTLKERFERRYQTLLRLKNEGKVGETSTGLVEAVESRYLREKLAPEGVTIESFIGAENSDRGQLYVLIAKKTAARPEDVARRNAKRVFEKALPDHYLKLPSGKWVQKKDLKTESRRNSATRSAQ